MTKFKLLLLIVLLPLYSLSQDNKGVNSLVVSDFKIQKNGMYILGAWAAANLISSPILASNTSGHEKYFHLMNGGWNLINLGLAGSSLLYMKNNNYHNNSIKSYLNHRKLQNIFLVNGVLDFTYMTAGLYLMERSNNIVTRADQLKGIGQSLLLQGAFLAVFDFSMLIVLNTKNEQWKNVLNNISLSSNEIGFRLGL